MSQTYEEALAAAKARRAQRSEHFKKMEQEKNTIATGSYGKDLFNISTLEPNETIHIRFINDPDESNPAFWRQISTHRIPFKSILQPDGMTIDLPENKPLTVMVPGWNCKSHEVAHNDLPPEYLYVSDDDPVNQKTKGMWSDDDKAAQDQYRIYMVKNKYVMYGFITKFDGHPDVVGHLYRFNMNKQLFSKIKLIMEDPEFETECTDLEFGYDFKLMVTKNGQFKDYHSNSQFSPKIYKVPDEYLQEIAEKNFPPLKDWVMKKPTPEQLGVISEMTTASIEGLPFKAEWAKTYMPYGWELNNGFLKQRYFNNSSEEEAPMDNSTSFVPASQIAVETQKETSPFTQLAATIAQAQEKPKAKKQETVVEEPKPVVETVAAPVAAPAPTAPVAPAMSNSELVLNTPVSPAMPNSGLDLNAMLRSLGGK